METGAGLFCDTFGMIWTEGWAWDRAVRWQQVGDTAAALRFGEVGWCGRPGEVKNGRTMTPGQIQIVVDSLPEGGN